MSESTPLPWPALYGAGVVETTTSFLNPGSGSDSGSGSERSRRSSLCGKKVEVEAEAEAEEGTGREANAEAGLVFADAARDLNRERWRAVRFDGVRRYPGKGVEKFG